MEMQSKEQTGADDASSDLTRTGEEACKGRDISSDLLIELITSTRETREKCLACYRKERLKTRVSGSNPGIETKETPKASKKRRILRTRGLRKQKPDGQGKTGVWLVGQHPGECHWIADPQLKPAHG